MRAEDLVALCTAHGVDLIRAAQLGTSAKPARDTIRHGKNGHAYTTLLEPGGNRARGRASDIRWRPTWSLQELGEAAAGVPRIPFLAACYAFAGDSSAYWPVFEALSRRALELRARYDWPHQVRGVGGRSEFYTERLAQLVLDEDANQKLFAAVPASEKHSSLYAIVLDVEERTWRQHLFERFDRIKLEYLGWLSHAMSVVQSRIRDDDDPDGEALA